MDGRTPAGTAPAIPRDGLPEREPLGAPCRYCDSADTWVEWRFDAVPVGTYSLAGVGTKVLATRWPYAVCDGCGHVSRGSR